MDYPIDVLKESTDYGYANTIVDRDGYVRHFMPEKTQDGITYQSLATRTYVNYMESQGMTPTIPNMPDQDNVIPFKYACGTGKYTVAPLCDVIDGWQIALQQMHVSDKWMIYIPHEMGYGTKTCAGIPGFSTLIFEVELLGIG